MGRPVRSAMAVAAAVGLGFALACGGMSMPGQGSAENVTACRKYVEAFNDAPCSPVDFDAIELCPGTLEMAACDLGVYYTCMAGAVKCSGDFLDITSQANCAMPACK